MTVGASETVLPERDAIDALFLLADSKTLDVAAVCGSLHAAEFLERQIVSSPRSLKRHVQRVNLHIHTGDSERLQAALVDLFIALGAGGAALKRRLLKQALPLLGNEQGEWLSGVAKTGLQAEEPHTAVRGSLLSRSVLGRLDYVARELATVKRRDSVEEARALLEEGDVDAAQRLLEAQLENSPHDAAVHNELCAIYVATRNEDALAQLQSARRA